MNVPRALLIFAIFAAASAIVTAGVAASAEAPKTTATPSSPRADTARADTMSGVRPPWLVRADSMLRARLVQRVLTPVQPPHLVAPNAGPLLPPGSPVGGRVTIAPWPVPGDPRGEASQWMKMMNVPRRGSVILLSPPPDTTRASAGYRIQLH